MNILNIIRYPIRYTAYCIFAILLLAACNDKQNTTLFTQLDNAKTGVKFINEVASSEALNVFTYRNFYNGGGVGIGDVNNDGLSDIFFCANQGDNKLYLNKGDLNFQDISESAGIKCAEFWSTGVSFVDINSDGWLDIYVCNAGYNENQLPSNALFINQQDNTFDNQAQKYGLDDPGYTTHAAFFDYDMDGDLDVYLLNNSFIPVNSLNYNNRRDLYAEEWPVQDFLKGGGDKLLRNDEGRFIDVTREANIYGSLIGFGLGITVEDFNNDNWLDLYISNDFYERDYLYINQKDGTFTEEIKEQMGHISLSSMGADVADINNDGFSELFVTEMLPDDPLRVKTKVAYESYALFDLKIQKDFHHQYMQNTLQLNNGNSTFSEIAWYSGVAASDWSWGALMFDGDNDGYTDIYVCNGVYKDVTDQDFIDFFANTMVQEMVLTGKKEDVQEVINKMPSEPQRNKFFRNQGNLKFKDEAERFGFLEKTFSNGAAYGDLDNDGDLDLVVNNLNQPSHIYRNNAQKHYLSIELVGDSQNLFAYGAKVNVHSNDEIQSKRVLPSRGFQSSVDNRLVFGLGTLTEIDSVVIHWPDLTHSVLYNVAIDTMLKVEYQQTLKFSQESKTVDQRKYVEITNSLKPHIEDDFVDFFNEGLLMRETSREGPAFAKGDVNKDGYVDLFVGGAHGQSGTIYLGSATGFESVPQIDLENSKNYEDTYAIFSDVNGDGWLDLIVGSGGNFMNKKRLMQDRLYINNGAGVFTLQNGAFSQNAMNTAVILELDFDADGDKDIILGSRSHPALYGIAPTHYLYINDGNGKFRNTTQRFASQFADLGMVTDAIIDTSAKRIVFVGEWMAPTSFTWNSDGFQRIITPLDSLTGWWYSIEIADVDNDGYLDYVLGNRGENFSIHGTSEEPAKMWVGDFDRNGGVERIITQEIAGRDIPIVQKRELTAQLLFLKKDNLMHTEYASKSIEELIPQKQLHYGNTLSATCFTSIIAWGNASGSFDIDVLPSQVQFSCVRDILIHDFDADGDSDILLAGNDHGFIPQFSQLDASYGNILMNKGARNLELLSASQSGISIPGTTRFLTTIEPAARNQILVIRNNDEHLLFNPMLAKHNL